MTNLAEFGQSKPIQLQEFRPTAKYFAAMDCLIYLREDCAYRAIRLDQMRTVLLHPQDDRAVGVKLKGLNFVKHKLDAILRSFNFNTDDLPLIALWETAFMADGDAATEKADVERRASYAKRALDLLEEANPIVPPAELPIAA